MEALMLPPSPHAPYCWLVEQLIKVMDQYYNVYGRKVLGKIQWPEFWLALAPVKTHAAKTNQHSQWMC